LPGGDFDAARVGVVVGGGRRVEGATFLLVRCKCFARGESGGPFFLFDLVVSKEQSLQSQSSRLVQSSSFEFMAGKCLMEDGGTGKWEVGTKGRFKFNKSSLKGGFFLFDFEVTTIINIS
jgi:hypothetical protein